MSMHCMGLIFGEIMNFEILLEVFLLGIALSMDAFAVSITDGLTYTDINKKKWEIEIIPLENELERQAIRWCLIEISKDKCFIYVYHIFKELPSSEILKELKIKKKNMINILKNFIENKEINFK